ncbi:MAG TPA: GNAT family N-acetyltransferase [Nitrosopumilaceae archaeon]|nr:GNAT family N-acetyltransferase [Nitrosopumilaceae archaeon]
MENVQIRSAKSKDIPIILELLYELGRPRAKKDSDIDTFTKLVKKYLKDSDKEILIAENNDSKIVGMISMVFLLRLNQKENEMYIPELVVFENYQKKGIGKKLLDSCIKLAKEKKCHRIRLESGNSRKESHIFYKKLGFIQNSLSFIKEV